MVHIRKLQSIKSRPVIRLIMAIQFAIDFWLCHTSWKDWPSLQGLLVDGGVEQAYIRSLKCRCLMQRVIRADVMMTELVSADRQ